jgi:hypothetical protein
MKVVVEGGVKICAVDGISRGMAVRKGEMLQDVKRIVSVNVTVLGL